MRAINKPLKSLALALCLPLSAWAGSASYSSTGALQTFTVPTGITAITIGARGAQGGSVTINCAANGGLGTQMVGEFAVTPGDVFSIMVGQQGLTNGSDAGGGGGTFVVRQSDTVALIVAGGGGGATNNVGSCGSNRNGLDASTTTSGTASANGLVAGGTAGNGGGASGGSGGGGGGFLTDGAAGTGGPNSNGKSFANGGTGGSGVNSNAGGYGGGGAGWHTGGNGGGGGGYSGGSTSGNQPYAGGGGGGSYNAGTNQINTAGAQSGDGQVTITWSDAPGAPTGVAATSGNAQLTVSFSAPTQTGSSSITGYTASCTPQGGGSPIAAAGASSPIVVTGLTNGTTYNCTVTATNASDTGPTSSPVASGTPAAVVPDAPMDVAATAGNAQISLAFAPPTNNGGSAITGYTASCLPAGGGAAVTATGTTSPIIVNGLSNGTAYTCTVSASNGVGAGAASAPVTATPVAPAVPVPSLSLWALILLSLLAAWLGMRGIRRM